MHGKFFPVSLLNSMWLSEVPTEAVLAVRSLLIFTEFLVAQLLKLAVMLFIYVCVLWALSMNVWSFRCCKYQCSSTISFITGSSGVYIAFVFLSLHQVDLFWPSDSGCSGTDFNSNVACSCSSTKRQFIRKIVLVPSVTLLSLFMICFSLKLFQLH